MVPVSISQEIAEVREGVERVGSSWAYNLYEGDWNDIPDGVWTVRPGQANSPVGDDGYGWRVYCGSWREGSAKFQQAYRIAGDSTGALTYYRYYDENSWRSWYQPYARSTELENPNVIKAMGGTIDFNDFNSIKPGMYRLQDESTLINPPSPSIAYGNVLVIRFYDSDTIAMFVFPFNSNVIYYKSANRPNWALRRWATITAVQQN